MTEEPFFVEINSRTAQGRFFRKCRRSGKSGRNTSKTHTPGRGHNSKSKSGKQKRFQKKQAKAKCDKAEILRQAKERWAKLSGAQKKLLPELDPKNFE